MATVLFSLAGSGLYTGFMQGIKANQRIKESFKTYDPFRILFFHLDQDLRNSVFLRDYPFQGKKEEIGFPVFFDKKVLLVHYFLKNHSLMRVEKELTPSPFSLSPRGGEGGGEGKGKILLANLQALEFQFPYKDEEKNLTFETFWLDEPYYGIPRSVRLNIQRGELALQKLVSIPQGRTGYLQKNE